MPPIHFYPPGTLGKDDLGRDVVIEETRIRKMSWDHYQVRYQTERWEEGAEKTEIISDFAFHSDKHQLDAPAVHDEHSAPSNNDY